MFYHNTISVVQRICIVTSCLVALAALLLSFGPWLWKLALVTLDAGAKPLGGTQLTRLNRFTDISETREPEQNSNFIYVLHHYRCPVTSKTPAGQAMYRVVGGIGDLITICGIKK